VLCFGLAAWLLTWFENWQGNRAGSADMMGVLLGDSRKMFAGYFYRKSDVYFPSGFYPTIFDNREAFQTHLAAHPTTALGILAEMSRRLRHADEVIGNLALLDVYARVARIICDLAQKQGEPVDGGLLIKERPTQQEIAGLIGTSRETVSRALNDFTRRGLLEMQGKQILVRWGFLREVEDAA